MSRQVKYSLSNSFHLLQCDSDSVSQLLDVSLGVVRDTVLVTGLLAGPLLQDTEPVAIINIPQELTRGA